MVISNFKLPTGLCPKCGAAGRFVSMEREDRTQNVNLQLTFECESCGEFTVKKQMHERGAGRMYRNVKVPRPD
jgi:predicted RNA-binding Zn-ribbon protein involved in translation (DUF1610 family)